MKRKIYHIIVNVDIYTQSVMSATEFQPWFSGLIDNVLDYAHDIGYKLASPDPIVSRINGGLSKYYTLLVQNEEGVVKVILEIRFANHTSKIPYEKHIEIIKKQNADIVNKDNPKIAYVDVVQPGTPYVKISIGKSPVPNVDRAKQVLEAKLTKIKEDN